MWLWDVIVIDRYRLLGLKNAAQPTKATEPTDHQSITMSIQP